MMPSIEQPEKKSIFVAFIFTDKLASLIIGKGGTSIKNISKQTHCKLFVKGNPGNIRHLEIKGTPQDVADATFMVANIIHKSIIDSLDLDYIATDVSVLMMMLLPSQVSGGVIGKRGENIKNIRKLSNARLKIIIARADSKSQLDTLYIDGSPISIKTAIEYIVQIYAKTASDSEFKFEEFYDPGLSLLSGVCRRCTHNYYIPSHIGSALIGKNGTIIKNLRRGSGAYVRLEESNESGDSRLEISGDPSSVTLCIRMIDIELLMRQRDSEDIHTRQHHSDYQSNRDRGKQYYRGNRESNGFYK